VPASKEVKSIGAMRKSLASFGHRWREKIDSWDAKERGHSETSHAQTFWSDLLRQFGVIPERFSLFEKDAVRATTGNTGSIDVFWSSVFLGEAKSVGKDLDAAQAQAMDYLAGGSIGQHEWPRYIIVTDFERLRVSRLGAEPWSVEFYIDDIGDHVDQLSFLGGFETVSKKEEEDASIAASKIMARLYEAMLGADSDVEIGEDAPIDPEDEDAQVERVSRFLTRILFLLYGDDAGLWREDLFYEYVLNYTKEDGSDLGPQLHALFEVLNTAEGRRHAKLDPMLAQFRHVNGNLFTKDNPLEYFDFTMREALLAACRFRWTRISPAVFGSMFQLVKSKEARRESGEHYTSETDILKTLGPMFLDELRNEADRLIRNKSTTLKELRVFRNTLAEHIFVDPASGCGNFLVVAYRELRAIETDVIVELRRRERGLTATFDVTTETRVTIDQFHGFELNWWPAKIAEVAMFLVDHQANAQLARAMGDAPDRLPIQITAHIHHLNSLDQPWSDLVPLPGRKVFKDVRSPSQQNWDRDNAATSGKTYVFGNPPFVGQGKKTDQQTMELRKIWGDKYNGYLDYVTAWHAQAIGLFADGRAGEFGFVTTNSITQGAQVPFLFGPLHTAGWRIKFAHRPFAWDSEAPGMAAVHCVIVGFTRDQTLTPRLWDYDTPKSTPTAQKVSDQVNAYLVDAPWVLVTAEKKGPLSAQVPAVSMGSKATGKALIVEVDEYPGVAADPIARKYLRPYRMGKELIHGLDRWCLWMADDDFHPADVRNSPALRERLRQVQEARALSDKKTTKEDAHTPHLFQEIRQPATAYLGIPRVFSANRPYMTADRFSKDIIAGDKVYTAEDPDGVLFALISSSMFHVWQATIGGRLKSDPNFANTLTWNTFPVPTMTPTQRADIIAAGQQVLTVRASFPDQSLADLYTPLAMNPRLLRAHRALDTTVDALFGATKRLTKEHDRQALLFEHYQRIAPPTTEKPPAATRP
jgi:hypothetical protein